MITANSFTTHTYMKAIDEMKAIIEKQADEIERLREALKNEIDDHAKTLRVLYDLDKRHTDEIERLREALRYCACTCAKSCGKHVEHDGEIAFVECSGWVARAALKESE